MATERFTNGAQTTLFAALDDSTEVLTVVSAVGFPGSGNFRVRIGGELLLVTGVSGSTWAVDRAQEGTAGAAHGSGAVVTQVLTAGALEALGGEGGTGSGGAFSVLGVAGATGGPRGDIAPANTNRPGVLCYDRNEATVSWVQGDVGLLSVDSDFNFSFGPLPLSNTDLFNGSLPVALGGTGATDASGARTGLGLGTVAVLASDTDVSLGANSDVRVATQKAVKAYVDGAVTGLLDFKGSLAASGNPNYPSGQKGDAYVVSAGGRVGGASGRSVDAGDLVVASADNGGGTESSVGGSWFVLEHNLQGALLAANNLSDVASAAAARTNLGLAAVSASGSAADLTAGTLPVGRMPALTGDVTTSAGAVATVIANDSVTDTKLRNSTALSVIGRSANSTGDPADIAATADGQYLRRSGGALGFGAISAADLPAAVTGAVVPTGAVMAFARAAVPSGWLECDGSVVSRSTYNDLYQALGGVLSPWGQGNGSTTFHLPDFRRRTLIGAGGTQQSGPGTTVGSTGGTERHTLTIAEIPPHTHGVPDGAQDVPRAAVNGAWTNQSLYGYTPQTTSTGGGGWHNNMQPSAVVLMCIKV